MWGAVWRKNKRHLEQTEGVFWSLFYRWEIEVGMFPDFQETWGKIETENLLESQSNTSTIWPVSQLGMGDNGFGGPCAGYILAVGIADAVTCFIDVHNLKKWGVVIFSTSFSLWLKFLHCLTFVSCPALPIACCLLLSRCHTVHESPCNLSFLLPCRGIHLAVLTPLWLCDPVLLYFNKYLGKKKILLLSDYFIINITTLFAHHWHFDPFSDSSSICFFNLSLLAPSTFFCS